MILPLTILLLTLYYLTAYSLLRYAVIHTLKRRVNSVFYREAVLVMVAFFTPLVITNAIIDSIKLRFKKD
jgi:hypothetical protein